MPLTNNSDKTSIPNIPPLIWGGLDDKTDDLLVISTLKLCLDHIGEKYSKVYLAGTSCAAFYTGWRADSLWSGMGGAAFMFPDSAKPGIANLFKSISRSYSIIKKENPESLWQTAVQSIDDDKPVVCVEWEPVEERGHFAILTGYDNNKKNFLGRIYSFEYSKEYSVINPANLHYILVIGEKTGEELPLHKSASNALQFAIRMSETGIQPGEEKGAYGLSAYDTQAKLIVDEMDAEHKDYGLIEHFLFWRLDVLYLCRKYAILYLDEIVDEFDEPKKDYILKARDVYKEFIKYFDDNLKIVFGKDAEGLGTNLLWVVNGKSQPIKEFFSNSKGKKQFADFLLTLKNFEVGAYNNLRKLF